MREQNALPYDTRKLSCLIAKDDVDNVGAGRAAKGAIPGRSFLAIPSLRSLRPHQSKAFLNKYSVKKTLKTRFSHPLGAFFAIFPFVFKASTILLEFLHIEIARANLLARAFFLYLKLIDIQYDDSNL